MRNERVPVAEINDQEMLDWLNREFLKRLPKTAQDHAEWVINRVVALMEENARLKASQALDDEYRKFTLETIARHEQAAADMKRFSNVNAEAIIRCYHRLAMKYHADRNPRFRIRPRNESGERSL
jgi:hypothetical protein